MSSVDTKAKQAGAKPAEHQRQRGRGNTLIGLFLAAVVVGLMSVAYFVGQ
jgi:hypothetical protein